MSLINPWVFSLAIDELLNIYMIQNWQDFKKIEVRATYLLKFMSFDKVI